MVGQVGPELRSRRAALFHGLANFDLPLAKPRDTRFVLTVHDLIPLEWPDSVSRSFRLQFRAWLTRCLQLADAIICPTAAVAQAVRSAFPGAPAIHVVPMGVTPARPGLRVPAAQRYLLVLGSVEVRKNLSLLLEAFASKRERWRQEGVELWIAGQLGFGGSAVIAELGGKRGSGVKYLGPQEPRALGQLMRGALALCAPSLAEGFGLPPLEAMALGIPVLASDIPAHREVLGDAAVLLPPSDPEAWSSALLRVVGDPGFCARLGRLGSARAAGFTWARNARQTEAVYAQLLGLELPGAGQPPGPSTPSY
jgi:glycosyltransferase involved in cell wall biosynthesis